MHHIDVYPNYHYDAYHFGKSIGECITLNCSKIDIPNSKAIEPIEKNVEMVLVNGNSAQSDFFINLH